MALSKGMHDLYLSFLEDTKGGIINTPDLAIRFAELLLYHFKPDDASQKLPLQVQDRGKSWFVTGSYNPDLKLAGEGPWEVEIQKRDAAITHMSQRYNYRDLPPQTDNGGA